MELWDKSFQTDNRDPPQRRRIRRENPSFSSSLLDAIYRSIDESNGQGDDGQMIFYRETTLRTKQSIAAARTEDDETLKFRRACMIEKWMDKKKVRNIRDFTVSSSSSSESTSTAGRRFSLSESEFLSRALHRPKPIKTAPWTQTEIQKPKHENGFVKTKSKASKIYHDLKKVKQPISPGGRLANFLNSLFNGGSPKTKQKIPNPSMNSTNFDYDMSTKSKSQQGSTCSSASSFSRSCLSKTPSSRGNVKRSVRFCPVSVIVDEDCQPCGHKVLQKLEEPTVTKGSKSYGNYETERVKTEHQMKINGNEGFDYEDEDEEEEEEDDDDDDDAVSCSSSDLFELDNLSVIGIERYREELPVYETTNFNTNCAIAKGLVV